MPTKLKVLILEDRPTDAELMLRELRRAGYEPEWKRVETEPDYLAQLDQGWEIILADYNLPQFTGVQALELLKERGLDIPFIIVSASIGEDKAVAAMKAGASDYVMKDNLARLGPAVERELRELFGRCECKRAEQAMIASELRYRRLFEAAKDGVLILNADTGRVVDVNPFLIELSGYSREALIGKQLWELGFYKDIAENKTQFAELQEKKYVRYKDKPLKTADGRLLDVEFVSNVYQVNHHQVIQCNIRDISARKRMEKELMDSEERYRRLFEESLEGVCLVDAQTGMILDCNPALLKLVGRERHEVIGQPQRILHPPSEAIGEVTRSFEQHRHEKAGQVLEVPVLTKAGEIRTTEIMANVRELDGRRVMVGIFRDVTKRKQAEERIRAQAELLDLAQDAIAVRDMNGCVRYWNKSCERLMGWTAAETVGRSIIELLKPDLADFDRANRMLLQQGLWSGELALVSKDGRPLTIMSRWTLVRDEQGRPKSVLVINTDITEHKKLEAQFLRAQRLEGIGALAGGIAHDLNNILAPMLMIAPLLRDSVPDDDSRAMLTTIESCAQRGADIIKQLLIFARGTPGARASLPMGHLLREMDKLIRETFPRDIRPVVDSPKDLWPLLGDATQLHQVLMNLCINARDALPDGGTLTLRAKNVTVDETFASMILDARPGAYVCVSVTDTGLGIAPENLERIFDPFFTTKEIGKGTGLGLATVLGIVRGHEGFVRVDSKLGHGTTFELYFPTAPEAKAANLAGRETPPPRGQGELILVVDDEPAVRDGVRLTLESQGYRVVTAAQGAEGLAVFSQHATEIRAVLADMMMPVMNGPAMITALRRMQPRLVILGMTGLAEQTGVKGLENVDVPAVLTKPFSGDKLLRALHAALQPLGDRDRA